MAVITENKVKCYHCNDSVAKEDVIIYDNKHFCCNGCKTVYELLHQNGLEAYYQIDENPGKKIKNESDKYDYLKNTEIAEQLYDFKEQNIIKITFKIPAIHCSSCIWLLENLSLLNKGVINSTVNFVKKQAYITFDSSKTTLYDIVTLLQHIGYEPLITFSDTKEKTLASSSISKSFYYKLGIAGFCFGNIMLLSFPDYLNFNDLSDTFRQAFAYLSLILVLPVVFYSASDYYISAIRGIKQKFVNIDVPVSLGITILFIRSVYDVVFQEGIGYFDSLSGLVFFLLIGKWYQNQTYQALSFDRDYRSYFPVHSLVKQDDEYVYRPIEKLKKGDVILLKNNEIVPCDALLLSGKTQIDYSFITGESIPVEKYQGDLIYAGGRQLGTSVEMQVQRPVSQSYLTQLWNEQNYRQSYFETFLDKISKYFTFVILLIAFSAGVYWWIKESWTPALLIASSVLIVACPCALALTVPFTFGHTLKFFGKAGLYLKNTQTVEKLASVKTLVFDKTGTLTENEYTDIQFHGEELPITLKEIIYSTVKHSSHPLSKAIAAHLRACKNTYHPLHYEEILGKGILAQYADYTLKIGNAGFAGATNEEKSVDASKVYVAVDNKVLGFFRIRKKYRNGIEKMLRILKNAGYELHLVSGDNDAEKSFLSSFFEKGNMQFNCSPTDKLKYIQALKNQGKKLLMIGDGLNDAGAIKEADAGISITDDIYNFSPASDAILQGDKLHQLPQFLRFSKKAKNVLISSLILSFVYNIAGIWFAVSGMLTPVIAAVLMPVSSVSVVTYITLVIWLLWKKAFR